MTLPLRFVVLHHDHPSSHFDFLLEEETACATWRLPMWPPAIGEMPIERLPDHRKHYLTYEGPVSRNRGRVQRVAAGWYEGVVTGPERQVILTDDDADPITLRLTDSLLVRL